jgi:nucleotidyltransferase substrate binding protein (TIGR01987 family)
MILDTSAFEKVLGLLNKSVGYLHSDLARSDAELYLQFRAATIQAFEYTYELAARMIRRQLEQIVANPAELREMAFLDQMRTAADAGLIPDASAFKTYREARNITAHTYDEDKAEEVLEAIEPFRSDMRFLLEQLKRRNHVAD